MKVFSIFESISGEVCRWHQGRVCTFVRFAGCNLSCPFCDQKEALSVFSGREMSPIDILRKVRALGHQYVILTGGEPLIQPNMDDLTDLLGMNGFSIIIETSGSKRTNGIRFQTVNWVVDYKGPSSGASNRMCFPYHCLTKTDFIKFLIQDPEDFIFAVNKIKELRSGAQIAFSPIHDQLSPKTLMSWIIKEKLDVILNIQIHKLIGVD